MWLFPPIVIRRNVRLINHLSDEFFNFIAIAIVDLRLFMYFCHSILYDESSNQIANMQSVAQAGGCELECKNNSVVLKLEFSEKGEAINLRV